MQLGLNAADTFYLIYLYYILTKCPKRTEMPKYLTWILVMDFWIRHRLLLEKERKAHYIVYPTSLVCGMYVSLRPHSARLNRKYFHTSVFDERGDKFSGVSRRNPSAFNCNKAGPFFLLLPRVLWLLAAAGSQPASTDRCLVKLCPETRWPQWSCSPMVYVLIPTSTHTHAHTATDRRYGLRTLSPQKPLRP